MAAPITAVELAELKNALQPLVGLCFRSLRLPIVALEAFETLAALTLQAFVQPALTAGPASLVFWAFWTAHTIIAACAVYDLAVLGFRPELERSRLRSYRERGLCRVDRAGEPVAGLGLRLHRQSASRHFNPAVRRRTGTLAATRDHPRRAGGVRLFGCAIALAHRGSLDARPAGYARRPEAARALSRSFSRASDHLGDDHVTRVHDQQPALHHGEVIRCKRGN